MSKKNLVNDKVIKAMAVGLSAVMSLSTPMTVMASEGTPTGEGEGGEPTLQSDEKQGVDDSSSDAVKAADEAASEATDAVTNADEKSDTLDSAITESDLTLPETVTSVEIKDLENVTNTDDVAGKLDAADQDITDADGIEKDLNKKTEDTSKLVDEANEVVEDTNNTLTEANGVIDEKAEAIANAGTIAEAEKAYQELKTAADEAVAQYDAAKKDLEDKQAAYEKALGEAEALKSAYEAEVASATGNVDAAAKELATAQENLAKIEKALADAKTTYENSASNALAREIEKLNNTTSQQWDQEDRVFERIIEDYYVSTLVDDNGNPLYPNGAEVVVTKFSDDSKNYFTVYELDENGKRVKYETDDKGVFIGKKKPLFLNYKIDRNDDKDYKNDLVIFEKREVEYKSIYDLEIEESEYDSFSVVGTSNVYTQAELQAAIKGGTVLRKEVVVNEAGDKKVVYALASSVTVKKNTLVDKTTIENSLKADTYQESEQWVLSADGNSLIQVITQKGTKISYTDADIDSAYTYASAEAAQSAAASDADLTANDTNVVVSTKLGAENGTYTVTGYYVPKFTETINVSQTTYSQLKSTSEEIGSDMLNAQYGESVTFERDNKEYYIVESDIKNVKKTTEKVKDYTIVPDEYVTTAVTTISYVEVATAKMDQWIIEAIFNNKEQEVREKLAKEGKILVDYDIVDLVLGKATYKYYNSVAVTGTGTTLVAAQNSANDKMKEYTDDYGRKVSVYDEDKVVTQDSTSYKYKYHIDYKKYTETNFTNSKESAYNTMELKGQVTMNKNYVDKEKKILIDQNTDKGLKAFLDGQKVVSQKYQDLLDKAEDARVAVETAQGTVATLQGKLADMIANGADMTAINSIQAALDEAVENLNKLEGEKEAIEQKLVDAENDRVNKITELTPSNVDEEEDDDADAGITPAAPGLTVVTLEPAAVPLAAAPVAGGAAVAGAVAEDGEGGNGGVVIEDNDTPLAGDIEDTVDAVATTIEDGETPLAAAPVEKMSWWWLLIVALLGATGYEMYRKHQAKKAELTEADK